MKYSIRRIGNTIKCADCNQISKKKKYSTKVLRHGLSKMCPL